MRLQYKLFSQGFELLTSCDSPNCQISMFSFDFNTSTMMKIAIFIVNVLHGRSYPLPSNRQHLSYDVCLEVRGEIIRTVLCCIVY